MQIVYHMHSEPIVYPDTDIGSNLNRKCPRVFASERAMEFSQRCPDREIAHTQSDLEDSAVGRREGRCLHES